MRQKLRDTTVEQVKLSAMVIMKSYQNWVEWISLGRFSFLDLTFRKVINADCFPIVCVFVFLFSTHLQAWWHSKPTTCTLRSIPSVDDKTGEKGRHCFVIFRDLDFTAHKGWLNTERKLTEKWGCLSGNVTRVANIASFFSVLFFFKSLPCLVRHFEQIIWLMKTQLTGTCVNLKISTSSTHTKV